MVHNNKTEYINQHILTLPLSMQRHWSRHHGPLLTFRYQHVTQCTKLHASQWLG